MLYPNPAREEINIALDGLDKSYSGNVEVAIYDISGKLQIKKTIDNLHGFATIDIRRLQPQLYFVVIHSENKLFTTKFIKGL